MPATTGRQYRFMAGVAHGMAPRGGGGPSQAVAEEFVHKTPAAKRSEWSKKSTKVASAMKQRKGKK